MNRIPLSLVAIVKAKAHEFSFLYKSTRTFIGALAGHARLLKQLGTKPQLTPVS